jgi:hypothetical protein
MSIGECELIRVDHMLFTLYRADEDFALLKFTLFTSSIPPATPLKVLGKPGANHLANLPILQHQYSL